MTQLAFTKATRSQSRLRMAFDGPAKSGKTYTSLVLASALCPQEKRVAVIDTERGSASKYADDFDFDVLELTEFSPKHYIDAIRVAEAAGYAVLVIDSLSHAWEGEGGALDLHDDATARTGNSWTAWRDVTPLHRRMVDAILGSSCHIICTMRSKMDYIQTADERGKTIIRKVGMAPIQRAGMEYEFDIIADMDIEHTMVVSMTRCKTIDGLVVKKPDARAFRPIVAWLTEGKALPESPKTFQKATPAAEPPEAPLEQTTQATEQKATMEQKATTLPETKPARPYEGEEVLRRLQNHVEKIAKEIDPALPLSVPTAELVKHLVGEAIEDTDLNAGALSAALAAAVGCDYHAEQRGLTEARAVVLRRWLGGREGKLSQYASTEIVNLLRVPHIRQVYDEEAKE